MGQHRILFNAGKFILSLLLGLTAFSCAPDFPGATAPSEDVAFVITGDRMGSASYSVIDTASLVAYPNLAPGTVHTDAAARFFDGRIYVVNRLGRDNIQVIDPQQNFTTLKEISMGAGSNPHDVMVVSPEKAYVTLYGSSILQIIDPATGSITGGIDLSLYAANSQSVPCMDRLYYDSDTGWLFVSVQRLDSASGHVPTDYSCVLVIDTATDTVVKEIKLQWNGGSESVTNPCSHFRFVDQSAWQPATPDGLDHLFISCAGKFHFFYPSSGSDGGIVAISLAPDLGDVSCTGPVILESLVADDGETVKEITDFVILPGGVRGYALSQDEEGRSRLFSFDPGGGSFISTLYFSTDLQGSLPSLALHHSGILYVCDRKATAPGVRLFDTGAGDAPLNDNRPLDVGLPPEEVIFIE